MWDNILGHSAQKQFLQKYLYADKRPHALLFCGIGGLGKRMLALEFAKTLLCKSHTGNDDCESCRLLRNINHPDLILVEREEDEKKRFKDINIAQIRELINQSAFAPVMSKTKVCIINDADKMVVQAANAFLKLLEEPPAGWVIILIADSVDKILPTILSRIVQLKFYPIENSLVEQIVRKQGVENERAAALARISEGSVGTAVRLYRGDGLKADLFTYREQALMFLQSVPLEQPLNYLSRQLWTDKNFLHREAVVTVQLLQLLLRDLLMCKLQLYDKIYNVDILDILRNQSQRWHIASLKKALGIVQETYTALVNNVGVKAAMEAMTIKIDLLYKE